MPPCRRKSVNHQSQSLKPYNLRSLASRSSSSSRNSHSSSPTSSISSDDSFRLKLTTVCKTVSKVKDLLSKDMKWLRKELAKATQDKEEACMERDAIATTHQGLLKTADVALQCQICLMAIESPFTLVDCHHTYCFSCIAGWFDQCIRKRLLSNVYPDVPEYFKNHTDPFTREEVEALCDGRYPILPGRHYECPTCRAFVYDPPIQIPFLRDVASAFGEAFGEAFGPDVKRADGGQPADAAERWAVFFKPF